MSSPADFFHLFPILMGIDNAYPWQVRLYEALRSGHWPRTVCLPTGAGKTSIIGIWLLARAAGFAPRRLVWVVNRRVVVDQATEEVVTISDRLRQDPRLRVLSEALGPLAVSTLRGEKADNREWSQDPSRAAVIVGTVDMVGSRLLFSGYGDGPWYRPQHAGLLGRDALIVNDEAHLTPAFASLLEGIEGRQPEQANFRVMFLTATPRGSGTKWPEHLTEDLDSSETFRKRYRAQKTLILRPHDKVSDEIKRLACDDEGGQRRLVFVQSPEHALLLAHSIGMSMKSSRVRLLTGTMRGFERDRLAKDAVFGEFLGAILPSERAWLIATSAGEVGVNLSSDILITELDTADRMIQRFGRLNRFAETVGTAWVVHQPLKAADPEDGKILKLDRKRESLNYLSKLAGNISCENVFNNPAPIEAQSEIPAIARLDQRLIELWSMTSERFPEARPKVAPWLHGKQMYDPPQTSIAWRGDVQWLALEGVNPDERREAIRRHRVLARETLTEPTSRAREKLEKLPPDTRVLVIASDGEVSAVDLTQACIPDFDLNYATVLLPLGCGRLNFGMLDPNSGDSPNDVADIIGIEPMRRRYLAERDGETWTLQSIGIEEPEQVVETLDRYRHLVAIPSDSEDGDPSTYLIYWKQGKKTTNAPAEVWLDDHVEKVTSEACRLAVQLVFEPDLAEAFKLAGQWHDSGKGRAVWQAAANARDSRPLGKPHGAMRPARLAGFRHEFGSVLDALIGLDTTDANVRDLTLHLIASHHGWSRPHFPNRAWDRLALQRSEIESLECTRRFARLQEIWGPWGLAYLEAVFKAADAKGSEDDQPAYA